MKSALKILVGLALLTGTPSARAADRTIEGIAKAIDTDKLSITLSTTTGGKEHTETLDVLKKVKVRVNGQAAEFRDLQKGQKLVVVYNSELEVITQIEASGDGTPEPESATLRELPNPDSNHSAPWVSDDGLSLYWKAPRPGEQQMWIWSARRKTKDELFEAAATLVPGHDPTVTKDELEMVLLDKDGLCSTTRTSRDAPFRRPQRIVEFQGLGFLASPCISPDGLVLYVDHIDFKARTTEVLEFRRVSRRSKWGRPRTVKFAGIEKAKLRFIQVTPDGRYAFSSAQFAGEEPLNDSTIVVWRRSSDGTGFTSPRVCELDGRPIRGKFPRYVAATRELFVARVREGSQADELVVIRNFDPAAQETKPGDAGSRRTDAKGGSVRDAVLIQGIWFVTHEEFGGKVRTIDELHQMNKRFTFNGRRLAITRAAAGQTLAYDGEFEIDPAQSPKRFDYRGKGDRIGTIDVHGIYELDGDTLKLCYVARNADTPPPFPDSFTSPPGSPNLSLVLKRQKP